MEYYTPEKAIDLYIETLTEQEKKDLPKQKSTEKETANPLSG